MHETLLSQLNFDHRTMPVIFETEKVMVNGFQPITANVVALILQLILCLQVQY